MMDVISLIDKPRLESFLRQDLSLHLYSLGDLDDFFWTNTRWMGLEVSGELQAVTLLYSAFDPPVYLALSDSRRLPFLRMLIQHTIHELPPVIYAHLSPGLESIFSSGHTLTHHGSHEKMILEDRQLLLQPPELPHKHLVRSDLPAIQRLYSISYPDNAFDPQMLDTGQVLGMLHLGELVCIAGVHVYSPTYRVAAIGNVSTHPDWRGLGFATALTASLCRSLLETVDHIGLNVRIDNYPALAVYSRIGFKQRAKYNEWTILSR